MNERKLREIGQRRRLFYHHGHSIEYPLLQQTFPANPEEEVRLNAYLHLVVERHYPPTCIAFEHPVKMGSSYKRIDIAVFEDEQQRKPFLWVECKRADAGESVMQEAIKQAFSYDNQLPAPYLWVTNGKKNYVYHCEWNGKGRQRYAIPEVPPFGGARRRALLLQRFKHTLRQFWQTYLAPQLQKEWLSKWLLISLLLIVLGLIFSWLNARTLTPFVVRKTQWLRHITFQHLYWATAVGSSLAALTILFNFIIPRKLSSGIRQKPVLALFALAIITVPAVFIPNLLFGGSLECFRCAECARTWDCWWMYAHFKLYKPSEWFWEYFTPYLVSVPLQALVILLTSWAFKAFQKLS
ncbi:type I restriction enzyme HsdR N-terminal domain-containing protein [Thermonema rossianum]|uniref:type I restriction enzyme HsdR N-terminal domain-containing protein n=1 Tax=Thermonema rossianum TaxID=55505 RepID=UPI0012FBB035|nr:type I restriction enzyme HsdR N-terminal domain-containing protein [Thermonema rossianum]